MFLRSSIFVVLFAFCASAQLTPKQTADNLSSFEEVWRTIRDRHPDPKLNGLDWNAVRTATRPRIAKAQSMNEVREVLRDMIAKLGASHYAIIPGELYSSIGPADAAPVRAASGITPVLLDGKAVVQNVEPDSPAARAGIKPGMILDGINGAKVAPMLRLSEDLKDTEAKRIVQRSVSKKLDAPDNSSLALDVVNDAGETVHVEVGGDSGTGKLVRFGNLPETRIYFETRELEGGAGYIRFNEFLDPVSIMPQVEAALKRFAKAPGIVLDLRGNPGGIGIMAMGIAGFFIDREGLKLGEMKMRETTLRFVIFPRPETYKGPLAVLVDAGSASTAEILAQGLQDLGRARIFGVGTAGAALPSDIVRLPNGDGFQFAQAGYTSEKGRVLEGNGVKPDVEVSQTQAALLAGHDLVIDAANAWITSLRR